MPPAPASRTAPIHIDAVPLPGGGAIGITSLPGRARPGAAADAVPTDLAQDLDAIRAWGAVSVLTLAETEELARHGVPSLGQAVQARGMEWRHAPIADFGVPGPSFAADWARLGPALHAHLHAGRRILLHCLGGLGRSGTVAAMLLVERGIAPPEAIAAVRAARPGAIETAAQELHLLRLAPGRPAFTAPGS